MPQGWKRAGLENSALSKALVLSLPIAPVPWWRAGLIATVSIAVGTLVRIAIDPWVEGVPFITFFPSVVGASLWGGAAAGTVTLLASALIGTYYWVQPQGSFALDGVAGVTLGVFVVVGFFIVGLVGLLHQARRVAVAAERHADFMAREMRHRVGNAFQLTDSIAKLTARHATSLNGFIADFSSRLQALAKAQTITRASGLAPNDVRLLVELFLQPYGMDRIKLSGDEVTISDEDATSLSLILHELATNAAKYGSLSVADGHVSVRWWRDGPDCRLEWLERKGPAVLPPTRKGFGTRLLDRANDEVRQVRLEYDPAGVRCEVKFPAAQPH